MDWNQVAESVIAGAPADKQTALAAVTTTDHDLLPLVHGAFQVRRHHYGRAVRLHVLKNAKSGACPEDCAFCSQSVHATSSFERYPLLRVDDLVQGARDAAGKGAVTYCMVTATRGPSSADLDVVCEAVTRIKQEMPGLRVCTSLGLLVDGQAERLAAAGVDRYNHNLETSERFYPEICTTHSYADRAATVRAARRAGMEACCGGILGMGESLEDWVDLAFALRELEVESVPVNFLDPRPGTPLAETSRLSPHDCLRGLAMFRLVYPRADLRVAGGRETSLGAMQPLALYVANSMFTDGYLTTPGAAPSSDHRLIHEAGFEAELAP